MTNDTTNARSPFNDGLAVMQLSREVLDEIVRQRQLGYDATHDDLHSVPELLDLVHDQMSRAIISHSGDRPSDVRRYLVRTAATAIATVVSLDRRTPRPTPPAVDPTPASPETDAPAQ
jgi:hypothetical protein